MVFSQKKLKHSLVYAILNEKKEQFLPICIFEFCSIQKMQFSQGKKMVNYFQEGIL